MYKRAQSTQKLKLPSTHKLKLPVHSAKHTQRKAHTNLSCQFTAQKALPTFQHRLRCFPPLVLKSPTPSKTPPIVPENPHGSKDNQQNEVILIPAS